MTSRKTEACCDRTLTQDARRTARANVIGGKSNGLVRGVIFVLAALVGATGHHPMAWVQEELFVANASNTV